MCETTAAPLLVWSRVFPAIPAQVREARQFLSAILDGRPLADDAIVCLSELVTNANAHSRSREPDGHFCVRVQLHGSHLRVEVSDQGGPWAQPVNRGHHSPAAQRLALASPRPAACCLRRHRLIGPLHVHPRLLSHTASLPLGMIADTAGIATSGWRISR